MLFLVGNIVFASSFLLTIKWMQLRRREDIITVGTINYLVAFLVATATVLPSMDSRLSPQALLTGGAMGLSYFIAFFFAIYAIRWIGAAGSTVISALSLVVPIVCGIFLWREHPSGAQVIGIVLALVSLILIGTKKNSTQPVLADTPGGYLPYRLLTLIAFFALCGTARLAQAAFKHVCVGEPSSHFTMVSFGMAAIPSMSCLLVRKRRIVRSEWGFGILMGVANAMQIQFIILALKRLDSFIVFPVTSAGALVLTTMVATRLLHEKLGFKAYLGIGLACTALVMLN